MSTHVPPPPVIPKKLEAVGPGLRKLLFVIFGLVALMGVNSIYLVTVTLAEWKTGQVLQNYFSLWMFLAHLGLGLVLTPLVLIFGFLHIRNTHSFPNRRAVYAGYALFGTSLLLIISGFLLMRLEGLFEIRDPGVRGVAYWAHVISPVVVVYLFILHRLAGPRIQWKAGLGWAGLAVVFAVGMLLLHSQDPRQWGQVGPESGEKYFHPSLARTATGNFIPAHTLQMDQYCLKCHADVHASWKNSMHRLSSFNNPAYLFSVRGTRRAMQDRDGDVKGSRFCAGCHDPVPFFSGAFDDPDFDDVNHPTAHAGITCSVCHGITSLNTNHGTTTRGNSDYTIDEPLHYPFATSENPFLQWINNQLVKARPELHRKTFLKPLHRSAEFCGTCHKVHLPVELNDYKFLRGQNHYDAFLLSGVSGHGITSFYYPPRAQTDCNGCHMPLKPSGDFGARHFDDRGELTVHDHQFPSANTAIPHLLGLPELVNEAHREFLEGVMRVDVFGLRRGGEISAPQEAPLRPRVPSLAPGEEVLIETVIRTLKMGHIFTQGTADSNQVWMEITVKAGERLVGHSGHRDGEGRVDPWSHFVNAYVLDREGNRIDRRNAEDIFVALYNHQIPPGAADVVRYRLEVPEDVRGPLSFDVRLLYRKFDTTYLRYIYGPDRINDLPITVLAEDRVVFEVREEPAEKTVELTGDFPFWQRWNDYGIGLLRQGSKGSRKGDLRQAEAAFSEVEKLGRPDGPLNLARVYLKEGRLDDAVTALGRATNFDPPPPPWSVNWFVGQVNQQNGRLDEAIENYETILANRFAGARERGFDFSRDYRVLNELGLTYFDRAKLERGEARRERREHFLKKSLEQFEKALAIDVENVTAHYGASRVYAQLGEAEKATYHRDRHTEYKPDDNARDIVIARHRAANPPADHAAEAIVIYDLHREDRYADFPTLQPISR